MTRPKPHHSSAARHWPAGLARLHQSSIARLSLKVDTDRRCLQRQTPERRRLSTACLYYRLIIALICQCVCVFSLRFVFRFALSFLETDRGSTCVALGDVPFSTVFRLFLRLDGRSFVSSHCFRSSSGAVSSIPLLTACHGPADRSMLSCFHFQPFTAAPVSRLILPLHPDCTPKRGRT